MKKSILTIACVLMTLFVSHAQDIIVLKSAEEIQSRVISITPDAVTYKRWSNLNGPTYTIIKKDIFYIKYENGEKDIMQEGSNVSSSAKKSKKEKDNNQPRINASKLSKDWNISYKGEVNVGFNITGENCNWDFRFIDNLDTGNNLYGTKEAIPTILSRPLFETTHGVNIGNYFFIGGGAGLQYYYGSLKSMKQLIYTVDEERWDAIMVPIYANVKFVYPIKDKLFPFVSLSLGYTAACHSSINCKISIETESGTLYTPTTSYENFKQKLQGGFYCDFGAGLKIGMVNFSVGLQHQRLNIIEQYSNTIVSYDYKADSNNYEKSVINDEEIKLKTKINSFYIKVGINF